MVVDSLDHPVFERESPAGMSKCKPAILEPSPGLSQPPTPEDKSQSPQLGKGAMTHLFPPLQSYLCCSLTILPL